MDTWTLLVPIGLVLARLSGFVAVLPVFGHGAVPVIVRLGLIMVLTLFTLATRWSLAIVLLAGPVHWFAAALMTVQEVILGLAMGLCVRMVFSCVQQGGCLFAQQMGLTDSGVIDPTTGEESSSLSELMEIVFLLFFLVAGGHRLLLTVVLRSFDWFPAGQLPDLGALAAGVVEAGATMLLLGVQLAGPALGGFLILAAVLGVLARVMPDLNILFESYPLRVAVGFLMAMAVVPVLNGFVGEVSHWIDQFLVS